MPTSETTKLLSAEFEHEGQTSRRVHIVFRWLIRCVLFMSLLCTGYWLFASDRYVSEAIIIIQNTEQISAPSLDVATVLGTIGSATKPDQLLLREHLLSVDMLKKLDMELHLREHYSDPRRDFVSRLWLSSIEWFHRYYLSRVKVEYDDYAGVVRIITQAYDAQTAQAITSMLVQEGEIFMNEMNHAIVRAQVDFLNKQVADAQQQVLDASKALLDFQNRKGLSSPKVTAEGIQAIIAKLENQRTVLQTQIASLPRTLDNNHPTKRSLQQSIMAVERQIIQENAKLASLSGASLNILIEEEQRLQMELTFKKDIYKTSLVALEKGKMDTARALKQVSVLQQPALPEYAWEPRRVYGIVVTLCVTLIVIGMVNLLKSVILDHVD